MTLLSFKPMWSIPYFLFLKKASTQLKQSLIPLVYHLSSSHPMPVGLVGPVGPIEPVGPVGPLTQYLLKYIIQYHLAQALGQPAPKLPNDIQLDAVNLQDPRTLVDMARRIAQELDDQKLGKILDHMN
eukprot:Phypoly_transcript_14000.p2 GENE.Phypoly_transcript_14000~~Phypoly_transcript_14000.p2  ORF type:complete len:128 (+),score=15.70 Phypoly_transcript_14000:574-957(+)